MGEFSQKLKDVLDAAPLGVVFVDSTGQIVLANTQIQQQFGYAHDELIGQKLSILLPEGLHSIHENLFADYMRQPKSRPMGHNLDLFGKRKDGRVFPIEVGLGCLGSGDDCVAMAFVADITAKRDALALLQEERLRAMELAIQHEKMILLQNLIRDVSHDFRTPLAVIKTSLHLIERKNNLTGSENHVTAIHEQVNHIASLVDNLFEMSKLDVSPGLELELIDVNTIIGKVSDKIAELAKKHQVQIQLVLTPEPICVLANEDELVRAVTHIAQNAVHFTPGDSHVTISCHAEDSWACIDIVDSGPGIPDEDLPHIFERFYRGDKARRSSVGESGLGLSIAKRIIDLHEGKIDVKTQPGQGSQFTVLLPRKR